MSECLAPAVRPAAPEDARTCAAILNAWIDDTPWMPRVHSRDDVFRHYREVVFPCRTVWVAGVPVVGFLAFDPESVTITALYVETPGQGFGKALMDRAKTQSDMLSLWTFQANDGARRFYAREGFWEVTRTDGENEEGLPDVRLEWRGNA